MFRPIDFLEVVGAWNTQLDKEGVVESPAVVGAMLDSATALRAKA